MSLLRDFLTVSRAKIQIVSLASALLGPSMAAHRLSDLLKTDVLLFIALFYITVTFSCNINCYYDRDVDRLYKKELYFAAERLGNRLKKIMLFEVLLAIIISVFLIIGGRWLAGSLALLGLILAYIYSAPPFRVKSRGIWSPFPVMIGVYVLPIIAGYSIISMDFRPIFWLFLTGYFFLNLGINLVNAAEDIDVDKKMGIETIAVRLGAKKTLKIALISQIIGIFTPIAMYMDIYAGKNPSYPLIIWFFLIISAISALYVALHIFFLFNSENALKAAKKGGKLVPLWFIITRYPLLFMVLFGLL